MNTAKVFFHDTIIGKVGIEVDNNAITHLYFPTDIPRHYEIGETTLHQEAFKQLDEYLNKKREVFDLPLNPKGTEFMNEVWKADMNIKYGSVATYKDIAIAVNRPKAYRAVGLANNKNPIPIFIPCHRVIGSSGKLVGYGGGIQIKQQLLNLEKE